MNKFLLINSCLNCLLGTSFQRGDGSKQTSLMIMSAFPFRTILTSFAWSFCSNTANTSSSTSTSCDSFLSKSFRVNVYFRLLIFVTNIFWMFELFLCEGTVAKWIELILCHGTDWVCFEMFLWVTFILRVVLYEHCAHTTFFWVLRLYFVTYYIQYFEHSSNFGRIGTPYASLFRSYMEKKSTPIEAMLDEVKKRQIEENRKQLRPIVHAIFLCGRQDIALRGHWDDAKYYLSDDVNPGNFIEILKYGVICAGQSLEEYFKSTPKNVTYKSKTTQNEIIDICGQLITNKITDEIREAKFFSVLADEAANCANVEQLNVVVRFVDRKNQIREEFLGFVPCKNGVSGEAIANTIQDFLRDRRLPIGDCRGQGYDRAGNMAGRLSGAAARIQAVQDKAIYVHCNSHILNLCVASCCKELLNLIIW